MSNGAQNGECILPEYAVDNLGASFKVILVNSAKCITGDGRNEIFIPDYQGLIKKIAQTRAAHPMKLKGQDIRFLRKTLGLKAKELADKLDISAEHLSRCESGDKILSPNSEKVLRSLVLLEAVYVLQKAVQDTVDGDVSEIQDKISKLLIVLGDIVSGLKISPVHDVDRELVLHFRRVPTACPRDKPANDHSASAKPEWMDEAA